MNRRLRKFLVAVGALWVCVICVLFFVAATEGRYRIATMFKQYLDDNGLVYSLFFGALLVLSVAYFVIAFSKRQIALKIIGVVIAAISIYALCAPEQTRWYANYFAEERVRERHSFRLQDELKQLTVFADVQLQYSYWPNSKGEILTVAGDVADQTTYDELVKRVESADTWDVDWYVTIDGGNSNGLGEFLGRVK